RRADVDDRQAPRRGTGFGGRAGAFRSRHDDDALVRQCAANLARQVHRHEHRRNSRQGLRPGCDRCAQAGRTAGAAEWGQAGGGGGGRRSCHRPDAEPLLLCAGRPEGKGRRGGSHGGDAHGRARSGQAARPVRDRAGPTCCEDREGAGRGGRGEGQAEGERMMFARRTAIACRIRLTERRQGDKENDGADGASCTLAPCLPLSCGPFLRGGAVWAVVTFSGLLGAPARGADEVLPKHITPETQKAIREALDYLARTQGDDGAWHDGQGGQAYPVAMTSLALTSLLAHGDSPTRGRYAPQLERGTE